MIKKIRSHKKEATTIIFLIFLLALIRNFEDELFYDPFISFFKGEFFSAEIPLLDYFKLLLSLGVRYWLNTIISLGIIYTIFKHIDLIKFATFLYGIFFILLIISFFTVVYF